MSSGIEAVTTATLSLALDAVTLRHQAIASNIANANTESYVPVDLDFSSVLANARGEMASSGRISAFSLQGAQPRLTPLLDGSGQAAKVQLDLEMAKLSENTMNYQALVKALGKHMSILSLAASDGKR